MTSTVDIIHPDAPIRTVLDADTPQQAVANVSALPHDLFTVVRGVLPNFLWWKVEDGDTTALETLKSTLARERDHAARTYLNGGTSTDDDGTLRWTSNDNIVPKHCIVPLGVQDADTLLTHLANEDVETREVLDRYRRQQEAIGHEPDIETIMHGVGEARAAGEDVVLVNALTGVRTTYRVDGTYDIG